MHIFSSRDLFWLEQKYDPIGLNKRRKSSLSTNLKSTNRVGYLSHEHLSTLLFLFNKSSQTLWGLPKKKNLIANLLLMTSSCKRERKLILGTFSFNLKPPGWGKLRDFHLHLNWTSLKSIKEKSLFNFCSLLQKSFSNREYSKRKLTQI